MLSLILCLAVALGAFVAGRRSLVPGIGVVLATGYAYGILRANLVQTGSHFIFDAAVAGLFLARITVAGRPESRPVPSVLLWWVLALMFWPFLLLALPKQDLLVQVVGFRASAFLVPFLLIGAQLDEEQRYQLALWCAALNLIAFVFAAAEYKLGLAAFFPRNAVTRIIWASNDVGSDGEYRIPSIFGSAHAYGGTMVATLPLLLGAWLQRSASFHSKLLLVCAIIAASVGVFMSAARSHFLLLSVFLVIATVGSRMTLAVRAAWFTMLAGVSAVVLLNGRLQRFTSLADTSTIGDRVSVSVNGNFLDYALAYPMGNGLGGGGSSMPYFLADRVQNQVVIESEYARIMLEQGIPGLILWVAFLAWLLTRSGATANHGWRNARLMAWSVLFVSCLSGLIGSGLLTSIPQSVVFLLLGGWLGGLSPLPEREHEHALASTRPTGRPALDR